MTLSRALLRHSLSAAAIALAATLSPAAQAGPGLYEDLGGQPGLVRLIDDFVASLHDDPRTARFFADADLPHLKRMLVEQVCGLAGGPCRYDGADMKSAHDGMDIRQADFNALVDVLEHSMDRQKIPFGTQRRLLALLAPMHRDVVNTP